MPRGKKKTEQCDETKPLVEPSSGRRCRDCQVSREFKITVTTPLRALMEEEGAVQDHVRFLRRGMRTRGKNQREMLETQSPVA